MSVHFVALLNVYVHLCVYLIQVSLGLFCLLYKRMCIMFAVDCIQTSTVAVHLWSEEENQFEFVIV